jgi:MFS family permease
VVNRLTNPPELLDEALDEQVLTRGTRAVSLAFATSGIMSGTWISRLPAVDARVGVGSAAFGLVLIGGAVGVMISLMMASRTCRRFGPRRVYTPAVITWALLYGAAVWCTSAPLLFAVLLLIGLANGVFAVVANSVGHELEAAGGRAVLPKVHGMFSVGALAGSLTGARLAGHVSAPLHVTAVAVICAMLAGGAARVMPMDRVVHHRGPAVDAVHLARPRRRPAEIVRSATATLLEPSSLAILGVGAIAMCATLAEGASNNWSAIFLHRDRGLSEGLAAAGFAVYAATMAAGRLMGNRLAERFRRDVLLRAEGILLVAAILLLVTTHRPVVAFVAMAMWGLAVAIVFPSAMGAAAVVLDEPAVGISHATLVGFVGFLIGPPIIGSLAAWFGLGHALLLIAGVGACLCLLAPLVVPESRVSNVRHSETLVATPAAA